MFIATDPLSLVFIACFLFGFLFFLGIALLGNLGHGHAGHVGHSAHVGHVGHVTQQSGTHSVPVVSHGHAPVNGQHTVSHAPDQPQGTHSQQTANQQNDFRSSVLSFINPTSIVLFLLGFGFFGYVFHNTAHVALPFSLLLAAIGGVIIAAVLLVALSRVFGQSEANTVQDVSDRTGLLGKVSITLQENGIGEIIYVSPGGMRKSIAARSVTGQRIERDTEVVVLGYQRGVAEVDTWEHFINEEERIPSDNPTAHTNEDELTKLRALLEESGPAQAELVMRKDLQKE